MLMKISTLWRQKAAAWLVPAPGRSQLTIVPLSVEAQKSDDTPAEAPKRPERVLAERIHASDAARRAHELHQIDSTRSGLC
jgi:hypothetical protein